VLPDTLAARLANSIQLRSGVLRIEEAGTGWNVYLQTNGQEERRAHAAVIYAAPVHRLPVIQLTAAPDLNPALLKEIVYPPVASVVLGFRRDTVTHPLDGFGMLVPEAEGFRILGTLFSSSLFRNRAPEGHVTLTTYIGGARAPGLALRPTNELIEMTLQDLRIILGVAGKPTFEHVVVYPQAIPQYEVGYGRFKDLLSDIERRAPGLFFAGHFRDGISLGDSLVSGHDTAVRVANFWKSLTPRSES